MTLPRGGSSSDRYWMEQALALGALAEGSTSPNPRVGSVLVRDGIAVGCGFHRAAGEPHSEALALADAGEAARGATLYVNLEPCAHEGRTPPCTEMLAKRGVTRVVAALRDPNPLVDGRGFRRLRESGIAVETGLLAEQASRLNAPFLHRHRTGRPLVTLKAAISLDGMIAASRGESRWISGAPARRFAHRLRLRHDAVLVGAGTVRRDDPRLTVRLQGPVRSRIRAVLAPDLGVDPSAAIFGRDRPTDPPTRIYAAAGTAPAKRERFEPRASVVEVRAANGGLDLAAVLDDLCRDGVQSVLVEGGGRTIASFIDAGLADRAALFVARRMLGARGGTPLLDRDSVAAPAEGWRLTEPLQLALGDDLVLLGSLAFPPHSAGRV